MITNTVCPSKPAKVKPELAKAATIACLLFGLLRVDAGELVQLSEQVAEQITEQITEEEKRAPAACDQIKGLDCEALKNKGLNNLTTAAAKSLGHKIWRAAQRPKSASIIDDRPLYWQRLSIKRNAKLAEQQSNKLQRELEVFERASRGFDDLEFKADATLNILITGFDPFGLHKNLNQTNPSGVAALTFDGLVISNQGITAELQSAVFPVRFEDFDAGMVESVVRPLLETKSKLDAIITISMGRDGFDLERFPARRRSAQAPDNLMVKTGASRTNPLIPDLGGAPLTGPEFVEFTLPIQGMLNLQTPYPVRDNRNVATLKRGQFTVSSLSELANETSVSGSGGGYLSNEISYRTLLLVRRFARQYTAPVAAGHVHTPRISGADKDAVRIITQQIRAMLEAALPEILEASRSRRFSG